MRLRELAFTSAILLSGAVFSQDNVKFDVYSKEEGFLNRLNSSSLRVSQKEIDFSFLFGIYSMEFKRINDSTYQEIADNNFLWESKKEFFNYSLEDSCYTLIKYFVEGGKPRKEKKALEGRRFDKKYRSLPELFNYFEKGLLKDKDSLHFIVNAMPYSVPVKSRENKDSIVYSCSLDDMIKREPGDNIIFPYPIEVYTIKREEGLSPVGFSTEFLRVKSGKRIPIKGKLREK